MKAIIYTEFGPPEVLHLAERPQPIPKDGEVLIRVHATPVAYGDLLARNFKDVTSREFNMPLPLLFPMRLVFGLRKPKVTILGSEFAGEVEAVGSAVTRFKPGDQVMGYLGQRMGAYAEYVCMAESGSLALKPANMSYAEAAAVPYGAHHGDEPPAPRQHPARPQGADQRRFGRDRLSRSPACQALRRGSHRRLRRAETGRTSKALGADHVIDYAREDFTQNGETYDLIFDVLGKSSFAQCKGSLKPNGIYLLASFKTKALTANAVDEDRGQPAWSADRQEVICAMASENAESLVFVKELGRGREVQDADRSVLSDGPGGRGPPLCRIWAQAGARRHHCLAPQENLT